MCYATEEEPYSITCRNAGSTFHWARPFLHDPTLPTPKPVQGVAPGKEQLCIFFQVTHRLLGLMTFCSLANWPWMNAQQYFAGDEPVVYRQCEHTIALQKCTMCTHLGKENPRQEVHSFLTYSLPTRRLPTGCVLPKFQDRNEK